MWKYLLCVLLIIFIWRSLVFKHNVCKSFIDYYYPEGNENRYHDPDATLTTPEIIKKYAGTVEILETTAEDGYILTLFRIPKKNPKGIILIHHSIATSSHIYLWEGNSSLALTLWREGYEVWLANQRGTSWSDKHVNMTSLNFSYWDFSFHEMGVYDVSSEINLIRTKTNNNSKIIFLGHSLGSSAGLVYASLKSQEAKEYLKSMILIAAPCYFDHIVGGAALLKWIGPYLKAVTETLRIGSPLIILPLLMVTSNFVLRLFPVILYITYILVAVFCGNTPDEATSTFYNFDTIMYLNNFSFKTLSHYLQLSNSDHRFQLYDYGVTRNMKIYGQDQPPIYPIKDISVPTLLISSWNDTLVNLKDSEELFEELPAQAKVFGHWKVNGLNHLDYLVGVHRREKFTNKLLIYLSKM